MNEAKKLEWWNAKKSQLTANAKAAAEAEANVAKEAAPPADPPAADPKKADPPAVDKSTEDAINAALEPVNAAIAELKSTITAIQDELKAGKDASAQATAKAATDLTVAVEKAGKSAADAEATAKQINDALSKAQQIADGIAALAPRGGMRLPRIDERGTETPVGKESNEDPAARALREERERRRQAQPATA